MSARDLDPRTFFLERIPSQFNRLVGEAAPDPVAGREEHPEATIQVRVEGAGGGTFYLNIASGRMSGAETADRPPLLTVVQQRLDFEALARELGEAPWETLIALGGAGAPPLTRARVERLATLRGTLGLEVAGEGGFALVLHLGQEAVGAPPTTRVRTDPTTFRELRTGRLEPQVAFLTGRLRLEGDLGLLLQLALATR